MLPSRPQRPHAQNDPIPILQLLEQAVPRVNTGLERQGFPGFDSRIPKRFLLIIRLLLAPRPLPSGVLDAEYEGRPAMLVARRKV